MIINNLNKNAVSLKEKFDRINAWIENNPSTDPNLYEMVECTVEYGILNSLYDEYYRENGYPLLEDEDREATHYELCKVSEELNATCESLRKMYSLRKNSEAFKDNIIESYIAELTHRCMTAEYHMPEESIVFNIKKEVLCKAAGIYFYIWQTKNNEPNYEYDNKEEFDLLKEKYEIYKSDTGIQEVKHHDDSIYEGPQFGEVIEKMINGIEKDYKYSNESIKKNHK